MIGILPAAGNATRIHGLPKFLLPIPDGYLLKRHVDMMRAEFMDIFIPTSAENYNLIASYPDYRQNAYIALQHETMTQTVCSALHHRDDERYILGLPDTYIEDALCYRKLWNALADCDVAVGVFMTRPSQRDKLGMVKVALENRVWFVIDKPDKPIDTTLAWGALAWKPPFWQYLQPDMPHVGYGLMPAIKAGLDVRAVVMQGGYWDCGTFDEYAELIKAIT